MQGIGFWANLSLESVLWYRVRDDPHSNWKQPKSTDLRMVFLYIGTTRHDLWKFLAHKLLIKIPSIQPRPRPVDAFHVDLLLHWECQLGPATKCGCWANGHGQQMAAVRESLLKAKHSWSSISICISESVVPIPNIAMGWTCLVTKKDKLWASGLKR